MSAGPEILRSGHEHPHVLRRTVNPPRCGFGVTLVNPLPDLPYSGMATGVVSGVAV